MTKLTRWRVGILTVGLLGLAARAGLCADPPDLEGRWEGDLIIGRAAFELPILLSFSRGQGGAWTGTITMPLQSITNYPKDEPLTDIVLAGDSLSFHYHMGEKRDQSFRGVISHDGGTIVGECTCDNNPIAFELVRSTGTRPWIEQLQEVVPLSADGREIKGAFAADQGKVRLLIPLSPTCPGCRTSARVLQKYLLERVDDPNLRVYVLWSHVFDRDKIDDAREASAYLRDPRVRQFWTESTAVIEGFKAPIGFTEEVMFDVFLVFAGDATWGERAPAPAFYMHNHRKSLPAERQLDAQKLADEIRSLLAKREVTKPGGGGDGDHRRDR